MKVASCFAMPASVDATLDLGLGAPFPVPPYALPTTC